MAGLQDWSRDGVHLPRRHTCSLVVEPLKRLPGLADNCRLQIPPFSFFVNTCGLASRFEGAAPQAALFRLSGEAIHLLVTRSFAHPFFWSLPELDAHYKLLIRVSGSPAYHSQKPIATNIAFLVAALCVSTYIIFPYFPSFYPFKPGRGTEA
eukprot:4781436-Pleurochrysis_carterae.AAC.2